MHIKVSHLAFSIFAATQTASTACKAWEALQLRDAGQCAGALAGQASSSHI